MFSLFLVAPLSPQQNDLKNFGNVFVDVIASPVHFEAKDWQRFGITSGTVSCAFLLDKKVQNFSSGIQSPVLDFLFAIDKYSVQAAIGGAVGTYIYGLSIKNDKTRELGLRLSESVFTTTIITVALKSLFGRNRPSVTNDNSIFEPLNITWEKTSFPSGHTSIAFAFSTIMAEENNSDLWKILWYSAAVVVGGARVYHNDHWLSDVAAGGLLGYFVGRFVINHQSNKNDNAPIIPPPHILSINIPF
ncbi:MAG TPA: phosphatase PAP2 family protein [Ignavibacteriaceae bacterium]|nr:phosphatase PAP2 family protein [Ignavibacteriaceae bacterium]